MSTPTIAEIFDAIPGRVDPDAIANMSAIYRFNILGPTSAHYDVVIQDGAVQIRDDGDAESKPHCTITVPADDLIDMLEGRVTAIRLILRRRLRISGSQSLALRIPTLLKS